MLTRLWRLLRLLRPAELRFARLRCPLCGTRGMLRLRDSEAGIRCLGCRGGPVQMSLAAIIEREIPRAERAHVYELSAGGALFRYLRRSSETLTGSEFLEGVPPGAWRDGIQCQDVQCLTYADESFDLCTSCDVFEHVVDDAAGFRELYRVLRPGGTVLFTVPLSGSETTLERALVTDSGIRHLQPPEYHDDHLRGAGRVLCFRTYGKDVVERLQLAGFTGCRIDRSCSGGFLGYGRPVVFGRKPA